MLSIKSISKTFAGRTLFADACLQINRRDRIGIVGRQRRGEVDVVFNHPRGDHAGQWRGGVGARCQDWLSTTGECAYRGESVIELVCAVSEKFTKAALNLGALGKAKGGEPSDEDYEVFESAGGARLIAKGRQILSGLSLRTTTLIARRGS